MPREKSGYVDPLLSGFAVDYVSAFARDLVGYLLAPAIPIAKPDVQYAYFGANIYAQLPDIELASNGDKPNRVGGRTGRGGSVNIPRRRYLGFKKGWPERFMNSPEVRRLFT